MKAFIFLALLGAAGESLLLNESVGVLHVIKFAFCTLEDNNEC